MIATPLFCFAAAVHAAAPVPQEPTAGIDRALAVERAARVSDVQYLLRFRIEPGASEVRGEAGLLFTLPREGDARQPLVLDFGGTLDAATVNGKDTVLRAVADHLILPADQLNDGVNTLSFRFRSRVAATGTPLTVYRDPADGREFFYTLVVPADAHLLYPCFDQPDLKARFRVALDLPPEWTAVANTVLGEPESRESPLGGYRRWAFTETLPLPTYLFAFACGPFDVVEAAPADGAILKEPLRVFVRGSQRKHLDRDALARLHVRGLRWLVAAFDVPYPFGKLDVVLLPGFPYAGMEHAGAIFYREQALLFDHPPTDGELVRRSTLVYHELSHQWFGNLVTMQWFDDLWLKEGFATFVAYQALAELEPERRAWLRFLQRVKPRAYEVDGTPGTTPVFQELQNLADAKSAYGAIVYNKAPAVLRELHERIGPAAFRIGLKRFLEQHAFGNATWRDLAAALEGASRADLGPWSDRWLLAPSMPRVRVAWEIDGNGVVREAVLRQRATTGEGAWPLRLDLLVFDLAGGRRTVPVATSAMDTPLPELAGRAAPACVLANPTDVAYGQFVPDPVSREWLLRNAAAEADPLVRAVMTSALLESVREAELDPARFAAFTLRLLAAERDPDTHAWLLDALAGCLGRWLEDERAAPLRAEASALLLAQLDGDASDGGASDGGASGRELQTLRFLARNGRGDGVVKLCRDVARQAPLPAGLAPGKQDRFLAAAALLAAGAHDGELESLQHTFAKEDVGKEVFLARAALPDAAVKAEYWRQYLELSAPPEQWTQDSLAFFHWPGQEALTLPYLRPALERVDWVKQNRRIFFMPAWLDGFVNGHSSAAALAIVDSFATATPLTDDVRRKLLQSRDGLARAVRIRSVWGGGRSGD